MTVMVTDSELSNLTRGQYDQLLTARGHLMEVRDAQLTLEARQAGLSRAVYDALESGVTSTMVAKFLGIGETSVRRMRKAVQGT